MSHQDEEKPQIYFIPPNISVEMTVLSGMISLRKLIEGVILAIPPVVIAWSLPIGVTAKISALLVCGIPPLAIGAIGINGDPVSTFIMYALQFRKKRRIAVYNPRLKQEPQSTKSSNSELPRERVMRLVSKIVSPTEIDEEEQIYDFDTDRMFFNDDDPKINKLLQERLALAVENGEILSPEEEKRLAKEIRKEERNRIKGERRAKKAKEKEKKQKNGKEKECFVEDNAFKTPLKTVEAVHLSTFEIVDDEGENENYLEDETENEVCIEGCAPHNGMFYTPIIEPENASSRSKKSDVIVIRRGGKDYVQSEE